MDRIKICALGGLDENGKNCYVIEINDQIFVLDAGLVLADKTIPGVDCLIPNCSYLIENKDRIAGYIITHAHEENSAALKYFYSKAPAKIYTTETTANFLIAQARIYHVKVVFDFEFIDPNGNQKIGDRVIEFFQTAHNAPNSFGVCIPTDKGNIIYTSDFIVDFSIAEKTFAFNVKKLDTLSQKKTLLLMSESKAANKAGFCSPRHRCKDKIRKYFADCDGRLFISCFWQNGFRLKEILDLAHENHRKIFFYDKYTEEVIHNLIKPYTGITLAKEDIIPNEDYIRVRKQEMLVLILSHSESIFDKIIDLTNGSSADKRITIEANDTFINCAIPTETMENLGTEAIDAVYRTGCEVVWLSNKEYASMHARQDDLRTFLSFLKPQYYMPVRGKYVNLMENARLAVSMGIGLNHMNVFILDNGMELIIDENGKTRIIPNNVNKIPVQAALVNGSGTSFHNSKEIIDERAKYGFDGLITAMACVSRSKKEVVGQIDCRLKGFINMRNSEPVVKGVVKIFLDEINSALSKDNFDFEEAKNNTKERILKLIRKENGRSPSFIPIVTIID